VWTKLDVPSKQHLRVLTAGSGLDLLFLWPVSGGLKIWHQQRYVCSCQLHDTAVIAGQIEGSSFFQRYRLFVRQRHLFSENKDPLDMPRKLLSMSAFACGICLAVASMNAATSDDGGVRKVPVAVFQDEQRATSATPSELPSGTIDHGAVSGRRDYRQELQYDSSILQIRSQLHGIARPEQNAVMTALLSGRIMAIHVQEGARVQSGERLASLDDGLAKAQVEVAKIEANRMGALNRSELAVKQAQRKLERLQKASLKTTTALFEIEELQSLVEQAAADRDAAAEAQAIAKANLKLAEEQLRRNTLFAPFDSVIVQIHQKVGTTVDPSLPVITLSNLQRLEVEMYVPVDRFGMLRPGSTIQVLAGAPIHRQLSATVNSVSPVIDSSSNTFRCALLIQNQDGTLPAGFTVTLPDQPVDQLSEATSQQKSER
jgi:RND family efflux transporter MFP subunit